MRALPLLLAALLLAPLAVALAPGDLFVGADPLGLSFVYLDPYDDSTAIACSGPMTVQVQRNTGGSWDALVRSSVATASPFLAFEGQSAIPGSAQRCPSFSAIAYTFTSLGGSPSTGLSKTTSTTCTAESIRVFPFTLGGPATLLWTYDLKRACYGVGQQVGILVQPAAMV